jgi:transposase
MKNNKSVTLSTASAGASALALSVSSGAPAPSLPDPEVVGRLRRRRLSKEYKLDVLRQADAAVESGGIGELLRREGLYHSSLAKFRTQRDQGLLESTQRVKRGPKVAPETASSLRKCADLERENRTLRRRLVRADKIIAIQKKVADLLGEKLLELPEDEED